MEVTSLASYRRCCARITSEWPEFLLRREERLAQQRRYGKAAEKAAENILEDLLTSVLDWHISDVDNQEKYADLVLTRLGIKCLIVEVKRPGALTWNRRAVDRALAQTHRYADEQKVQSIAVSDGIMLYARDHDPGRHPGDRAFVRLDQARAPLDLWWVGTDGIHRHREDASGRPVDLLLPPHRPRLHSDLKRLATIGLPRCARARPLCASAQKTRLGCRRQLSARSAQARGAPSANWRSAAVQAMSRPARSGRDHAGARMGNHTRRQPAPGGAQDIP